jgi:hypothetical protein
VGFFGSCVYDGASWRDVDADADPAACTPAGDPWLSVTVHDSDIATLRYSPSGAGSGTAFVGITPRIYFDDPQASQPTDVGREADGLATWVGGSQGRSDLGDLANVIRPFLAADRVAEDSEEDDLDDAEVFAEIKVARLLSALQLPLPPTWPS